MKTMFKAATDIETYYLYLTEDLIIELKIFNTSYDYLVLANSKFPPYHGVKVIHEDKSECVRIAMERMYQLIKE